MAKIGKYELIRQLATGGMAEVFLAKTGGALGFEKMVVVKRIRPHLLSDPQFLQMFLNEAKIAAQLNHPNIAQVFDFGEAEGAYYLAMEYIDGPNLRALSTQAHKAGQPIPFPLCAKIISYACEGLAYAHEYANPETKQPLDIVHRDVSPDNIVLAKNGAVKVVDFGIAKAAEQLYQTQSGLRKGKLAYMSPEYLKGTQPDRRADVFALGVVLYELISNKKPYDAESEITLMHAMIYEPMVPVRTRRPDVPEDLEWIVERALTRDREERYPSCRELQAALERFVVDQGEPLSAVHISRVIAGLQSELDAAALAKTPNRGKSTPSGSGKTPSGQKTPPKKSTGSSGEKKRTPSGEKPKAVTPPKAVSVPAVDAEDRTVRMSSADLAARATPIYGEGPSNDATLRLTAKDLPGNVIATPVSFPPAAKARSGPKPKPEPERESKPRADEKTNPALDVRTKAPARAEPPGELLQVMRKHAVSLAAAAVALLLIGAGIAIVLRPSSPPPAEPPKPQTMVQEVKPVPSPPPASHPEPPEPAPNPAPAPTPPAPTPAPVAAVTVTIRANVSALVKIAKKTGPSPFTIALKPGRYPVELVNPSTGYWMKRAQVEVAANRKEIPIEIAMGTLRIDEPKGALIYVDGAFQSKLTTPGTIDLHEGMHHLHAIKPPKSTGDQDVEVQAGKVKSVVLDLR